MALVPYSGDLPLVCKPPLSRDPVPSSADGFLIADKPEGMSSARLVAAVKRWGGFGKVGHAGTLDPFATGVMILCIHRATRLAGLLLNGEKAYRAVLRLGVETDTQDRTGTVTRQRPVPNTIDTAEVCRVLAGFVGEQDQQPPVFSALKHHGVPLYKLARKGRPVQKPPRRIRIESVRLEAVDLPDVTFHVRCSAGTYIRTLAADIGNALGTGGHLTALRRVSSCGFDESAAMDLETIRVLGQGRQLNARMIPMTRVLAHVPEREADNILTEKIKYGTILHHHDLGKEAATRFRENVKIVGEEGALLALLRNDAAKGVFKYVANFIAA